MQKGKERGIDRWNSIGGFVTDFLARSSMAHHHNVHYLLYDAAMMNRLNS